MGRPNGAERANLVEKIEALLKGELAGLQWVKKREEWGITGRSLASDMPDAPEAKETMAM